MAKGFLSIILHAHLPYVRHPEHDHFFEENWLFEAITECYLPLLNMLDRLQKDSIDFRLTLSVSPTLITLLQDNLLRARYLLHLQRLVELSEKEIKRTRKQREFQRLARLYRRFFIDALQVYQHQYQGDLLAVFKKHQTSGKLCLITTAATHGFLPLLNNDEVAVQQQIKIGIDTFTNCFGFQPDGFWLPECGYYPGLEKIFKDHGIRYFFVDSHAILNASHRPPGGVYAPLDCGNGVVAFSRDPSSSEQVWSAQTGYPGDADYRDYYRDIGYDLPMDYLASFLLEGTTRTHTGIKYYKVTGSADKLVYQPAMALTRAKQHAVDFIEQRRRQLDELNDKGIKQPVIVAPYDAELFGHWWFEGPHWLEYVLRQAVQMVDDLQLITCNEYLTLPAELEQAVPCASSWGEAGYSSYWLNEDNEWIYPLIHKAAKTMQQLVEDLQGVSVSALQRRALNQALRSLLLAQASDWPFILKSGTATEYAEKRITDCLARFNYLHDCIRKNQIDERFLMALEIMDDIFPGIDFREYVPSGQ